MKNTQDQIKKITEDLLSKLQIQATVEIVSVEEGNDKKEDSAPLVNLTINTEETGILIGYHGETLSALQLVVALISYKQTGSWTRVVLDVGDYRAKKEEQLAEMAKNIAERVKNTNQAIAMPYLSSSERRYVHVALQEDPDVSSESEGEGPSRRLVIKPRVK